MKGSPIERSRKQVFKPDQRRQTLLFPPSLEELINPAHAVRFIDEFVDELDITDLLGTYKGGGSSAYHPRMLLKLLLYGYLDRSYSSRVLEKQCKENICYMWLCGGQEPDHNTIANFRSQRMQEEIKTVFKKVVRKAYELGIIRLKTQMVDGTILESVANRYSFVWSKNIARFKGNLEQKILGLLAEAENILQEEESQSTAEEEPTTDKEPTTTQINSETLSTQIENLETIENKQIQKIVKTLKGKHLPKLNEYEQHQANLNGRNSYSKTDPDATFMRTKDDHMKNGQLKPAYNWMISTENQFIVNYSIHQNPNDAVNYQEHTEQTLELLQEEGLPTFKRSMGDSVFGTEENYEYLQEKGMDSFLKYPSFHSEQKKKVKNNPFLGRNFFHNQEQDFLVCPMGQRLPAKARTKQTRKSGYEAEITVYQAQNCQGCPLRSLCQPKIKQQTRDNNRTVSINHNLEQHKKKARENLNSLQGIRLRSKRRVDVEPPFGNVKYNNRFSRLTLRSIPKVNVEVGLLSLAHNLKKIWKFINRNDGIGLPNPNHFGTNKANKGKNRLFYTIFKLFATTELVKAHRIHFSINA